MEPKVKKYQIVVTKTDDGYSINRTCDGFSAIELLGVLEHAQLEIMEQMAGRIKPNKVKRTIIIE